MLVLARLSSQFVARPKSFPLSADAKRPKACVTFSPADVALRLWDWNWGCVATDTSSKNADDDLLNVGCAATNCLVKLLLLRCLILFSYSTV